MPTALVIGGTGFVGRHTVTELLDHDYHVASLSRGTHQYQPPDHDALTQYTGDRRDEDTIADVTERTDPDVVVDCAAYHPSDVETAIEHFADVDAYVYVSSGATYSVQEIPKREDETPLHDCTPEQATDDTMATYGPRKAECDRLARAAADDGIPATSVRPTVVYGPQTTTLDDARTTDSDGWTDDFPATWADDTPDLQSHHDYWIDRINNHDRVVVPGDGTAIWHRAYVEDVASALRTVAERGQPGDAYNVADQRVCTLEDVIDHITDALDTTIDVVHTSERELQQAGLTPDDFILYHHPRTHYPHVLDTCKLTALDWTSTPIETATKHTVEESLASNRTGDAHDPGRDREEKLLEIIAN